MTSIPLVGYSDKISLRSEETISFKVSSSLKKPFKATLVKSRIQNFDPGSYAITKKLLKINIKKELNINVKIFPTLNIKRKQTILAYDNIELYIDSNGKLYIIIYKEKISI